ncbi:unnamed protein product [Gordionus sp. m RMFG-2023]
MNLQDYSRIPNIQFKKTQKNNDVIVYLGYEYLIKGNGQNYIYLICRCKCGGRAKLSLVDIVVTKQHIDTCKYATVSRLPNSLQSNNNPIPQIPQIRTTDATVSRLPIPLQSNDNLIPQIPQIRVLEFPQIRATGDATISRLPVPLQSNDNLIPQIPQIRATGDATVSRLPVPLQSNNNLIPQIPQIRTTGDATVTHLQLHSSSSPPLNLLPNVDDDFEIIDAAYAMLDINQNIYGQFVNVIKGCFFHYSQALWRKCQALGLVRDYLNDSHVHIVVRRMTTLPFCKEEHLAEVLLSCYSMATNNPSLLRFMEYMDHTWLGETALFPQTIWTRYHVDGPRTNNHLEGKLEIKKTKTCKPIQNDSLSLTSDFQGPSMKLPVQDDSLSLTSDFQGPSMKLPVQDDSLSLTSDFQGPSMKLPVQDFDCPKKRYISISTQTDNALLMDASTQTNISLFSPTSNVCTAECQTLNLQVLDITNSPIMNPEVMEEIDAHNRIINSPTIIQNNQYTMISATYITNAERILVRVGVNLGHILL